MNELGSTIKELLSQILDKLEVTDATIKKQGEEVNKYLQQTGLNFNTSELLIAHKKSIRTSLELLRNDIEELYEEIKLVISKINNETDKAETEKY